jgi:hypothetical protein
VHSSVRPFTILSLKLLATGLFSCVIFQAQTKVDKKTFTFPKDVPAPADNKVTPARVQLGEMPFGLELD